MNFVVRLLIAVAAAAGSAVLVVLSYAILELWAQGHTPPRLDRAIYQPIAGALTLIVPLVVGWVVFRRSASPR